MNKNRTKQPFALIMYGPTGVGKTDVALSLASQIPCEIINMDVGQFYSPLTIGTAKPDWKLESTAHHLFDSVDTPRNYTVVEYRKHVAQLLNDIIARGKLPIIVGGSTFYLYSLLFPPLEGLTAISSVSHEEYSWDILHSIDPERAQQIEKNDTYRIARAIDVWNKTGKIPTTLVPEYNPLADYLIVYVIRDTQELNTRIQERIIAMMNDGWIEETKQLITTEWEPFIRKKKIIGYNEIIDYITGDQKDRSFDHMVDLIGNKTRQYAKRQRTFWRKVERDLKKYYNKSSNYVCCTESLNLTNTHLQLYINELLKRLYTR